MSDILPVVWTPEKVRRFWGMVAESPMRKFSFSLLNSRKMIGFVESWLSRGKEYLDFGAGDGDFVRAMLNEGYRCAAYEVSNRMRGRELSLQQFPGFLGIMEKGGVREFDGVFLLDVIEHILKEEMDETMEVIKSFMKPDGILIVSTPNEEDLDENYCICPECLRSFHKWQHMRSYSEHSLEEELARYGFSMLEIRKVDFSDNAMLVDRVRRLERELEEYQELLSGNMMQRLYKVIMSGARNNKGPKGEETSRGRGGGSESHLIYIGKISG